MSSTLAVVLVLPVHQPPTFARGRAPGGLDTGQRRTPGRPWRGGSIRPGGRGPGGRQDRVGSRAEHAFSPGLAEGPRRRRGQRGTQAQRHEVGTTGGGGTGRRGGA